MAYSPEVEHTYQLIQINRCLMAYSLEIKHTLKFVTWPIVGERDRIILIIWAIAWFRIVLVGEQANSFAILESGNIW